jgi:hypothetical protein
MHLKKKNIFKKKFLPHFQTSPQESYGFVYKAVLADGRQVAIKRENAAHYNSL